MVSLIGGRSLTTQKERKVVVRAPAGFGVIVSIVGGFPAHADRLHTHQSELNRHVGKAGSEKKQSSDLVARVGRELTLR